LQNPPKGFIMTYSLTHMFVGLEEAYGVSGRIEAEVAE
jgi:hypothetical protein